MIAAPPLRVALGLPLAYFAPASLLIYAFGTNTPFWVSNAIAVAALLRSETRSWPVLLLLAAAAGFAATALFGGGPAIALGGVACDSTEALLVAGLLRRSGGFSLRSTTGRQMALFVLICLLVPAASAVGGAGILALAKSEPFLLGWRTWYFAAALGQLIVLPLLLGWTEPIMQQDNSARSMLEAGLVAAVVAVVSYLDFFIYELLPGVFLAFPLLLAATFRLRLLGATSAVFALSAVAAWLTLRGHGPFAALPETNLIGPVQALQIYLAVVLLSTLPVAGILEQREVLTASLRASTEAAEAAQREAEDAARAKSDFLATMSHEIRTPMTAVLGMTDMLAAADLPEKERRYVAALRTSGRHLLTIINDILDFSRIEAGGLELESTDFSVPQLLEGVRSLMAPQAVERGLDLRFELDQHSPPVVKGDPTRLTQVLINLVGNALKFTARGSVAVTACHRAKDGERERFRFEVRDTGIGIPEEKRARLFDAFSQADESTTRKYGGTGLGLAISKRLVEAMGGEIGVESVVGVGTRFWFEVPLEWGDAAAIKEAVQNVPVAGPPRRVLLVEDVELNRQLIAEMLRRHGHEVAVASNGKEAVEAVARERFDLVLMDVQMPVMDGVEATRRIRALPPPASGVPLLALTANVMASEKERYLAAGMNDALTKPVDWPQLMAAVARWGRLPDGASEGAATVAKAVAALPPVALTGPEPVLDRAVMAQLEPIVGREAMGEMLRALHEEIFQRAAAIGAPGAHAGDIGEEAHKLTSAAGNFGLRELSACTRDLMEACRGAEAGAAPALVEPVREAAQRALRLIDAELSAGGLASAIEPARATGDAGP